MKQILIRGSLVNILLTNLNDYIIMSVNFTDRRTFIAPSFACFVPTVTIYTYVHILIDRLWGGGKFGIAIINRINGFSAVLKSKTLIPSHEFQISKL